jgi:hypothetical protein
MHANAMGVMRALSHGDRRATLDRAAPDRAAGSLHIRIITAETDENC